MTKIIIVIVCFVICASARVANKLDEDFLKVTETNFNKLKISPDLNISTDENINTTHNVEDNDEIQKEPIEVGQGNLKKPLLLTPLINKGKVNVARRLSKVDPAVTLGLASHSGYLTVDEQYNSNLFFWYFPVPDKPLATTPWIIWLQGGPGASSMLGLLAEIGPIKINEEYKLDYNVETWGKSHSLLFIDNPVGAGFSYSTDLDNAYPRYTNQSSAQLYQALQQFLQVFPELRRAPLFVAGESYAGKYVPGLALEIHSHGDSSRPINLKGLAIGNGFVDPSFIASSQYSRVAYNMGVVSDKERRRMEQLEHEYADLLKIGNGTQLKKKWLSITAISAMALGSTLYNILQDHSVEVINRTETYFKREDIRQALHVGNRSFTAINWHLTASMRPDFIVNYRPAMETLLEHYKLLMYSGHLDLLVPYVAMSENLKTWKWSGREKFLAANRASWIHDRKLAGFIQSGGNLTEVVIWNAGHMAPIDQPRVTRIMMEAFTSLTNYPN